jgi:hypothetical protein
MKSKIEKMTSSLPRFFSLPALLLPVLLMSSDAGAAASGRDRMVRVDDSRVSEALRGAIRTKEISEEIGRRIGILMYEDNRLNANESDLFLELLNTTNGNVEITDATGDNFMVPALSQGARDFLALSDNPDIGVLWLAGPTEMKKLSDITILNPHIRIQVQHFIANQLYLRWQTSTYINGYSPLRTTLSAAFLQWRDAGLETLEVARELLYDSLVELDMAVGGDVPDDMYERLKES